MPLDQTALVVEHNRRDTAPGEHTDIVDIRQMVSEPSVGLRVEQAPLASVRSETGRDPDNASCTRRSDALSCAVMARPIRAQYSSC